MGDTKRTRERSGINKREAQRRLEIERELDADEEPPSPAEEEEDVDVDVDEYLRNGTEPGTEAESADDD